MPNFVAISSKESFDAALASIRRSTRLAFWSAVYDMCMAVTLFVFAPKECFKRLLLLETKEKARDIVTWDIMIVMNSAKMFIFVGGTCKIIH